MEKPDVVTHYEELQAAGQSMYFDPVELDEIYHFYAEQNQLDKVEQVLRLAQQLHADDMLVEQMATEYELNCGDAQKALDMLDRYFSPDHPFQCILRSAALAKVGRTAEAMDMAEQALIDDDPKEYVSYDLALGFMNAGLYPTALHYYERSLRQHPDDVRTLAGMLYCYSQQNNFGPVPDLAERILALDPFNYEAWVAKGNCAGQKEQYAEAMDAYEYAIAIAPDEPDPLVLKARCLDALGQQEEAINTLREAAQKAYDDQRSSIYTIIAGLLEAQKRHQEAIDACWESISDMPDNPGVLMRAAFTFQDLNCPAETATLMRAAAERCPDDPAILGPLAEAYGAIEHYDEAAQTYEKLCNIAPSAGAYAMWGGTMMSLGQYGQALKLLKKANEMDELWQTYILMASCCVELKYFKKMEEYFRLGYALCPDGARTLMEQLTPSIVKQMEDNGFLRKLEIAREKWICKRENELRLKAENARRDAQRANENENEDANEDDNEDANEDDNVNEKE